MIRTLAAGLLATTVFASPAMAQTKLLRDPALSDSHLAFAYAGDIYVAAPDGSNPRRLTSHAADERDPVFSPDGSMIAFSANYDGNYDVFVVPTAGGTPKRLTWHPGADYASDFSLDGQHIVFNSAREVGNGRSAELYRVPVAGGFPEKISEIKSRGGTYDRATGQFANVPGMSGYNGLWGGSSGWRGYRGGTVPSIEVVDFEADTLTEIPGETTTEFDPEWMDGRLYFLSDRNDKVFNVFTADPSGGEPTQITNETEWDVRAFDVNRGRIVYEAGGELKFVDLASGQAGALPIALAPDLPMRQPQWKDLKGQIEDVRLSPSAKRVAVTARGEVFTVPTDQGSTRNISSSAAVRNYTGIWSHDGTQLAYLTDDEGTQTLVIEDQSGIEPVRRIPLGSDFYRLLDWGGDGKHLIYSSNRLALHALDVATGSSWQIDQSARRNGDNAAVLSPEGRWLAYTRRGANFNASLHLYDLAQRRSYPVTGEFADIGSPAFSKDGKLLFFAASTNAGPQHVGLDMTSQEQPYRAGLYAVVLEADGESPLAPVLAEESAEAAAGDDEEEKDAGAPVVDPTNLMRRTVALPVPEASYGSLASGKDGALYYVSYVQPGDSNAAPGSGNPQADAQLKRFDFEKREEKELTRGVTAVQTDAAGENLLLMKADQSMVTSKAGETLDPKPVDLSGLRMQVDPAAEWRQIFNDVWRMEKAYFYDPNMQGLDWEAVREKYEPLLAHVGRREDLNELLVEMIGEMQVGHNRTGGGDVYDDSTGSPGLLGADIALEGGRYRIERIFDGEQWNPFIEAPLAAPGVDVKEGDYILAVNGRELSAADNIFEALSGSAGTQVALTVASTPSGTRRTSIVKPVANENGLRLWTWVEDNRRRVDQATNGRVGYVYLPNTADAGYTFFNRMYFAQSDKQAVIIDERSNGGGQAANYVIDVLSRPYLSGWKDREGLVFDTPGGAIHGPKVMLIDQDAGSGGDWMPYAFREAELGPLMGTRTWGGLIGISANPGLIDGGYVTVPYFRFFDNEGRWTIENMGVSPDIPVELDQMALEQGRDTQLETAIAWTLRELESNPPRDPNWAPAYPTRVGE
ncbi:PDZ domain-containing protein [Qipengyuania sp. MTN3-11]|uniref:S41 family peptidase n=1 Tax=Qipengyuania sp. MTN3-11 TaxID=3056557 RepID=UPI0036F39C26